MDIVSRIRRSVRKTSQETTPAAKVPVGEIPGDPSAGTSTVEIPMSDRVPENRSTQSVSVSPTQKAPIDSQSLQPYLEALKKLESMGLDDDLKMDAAADLRKKYSRRYGEDAMTEADRQYHAARNHNKH